MSTTIQISDENHERLKGRKLVDREPFDDVVERLLDETAGEE